MNHLCASSRRVSLACSVAALLPSTAAADPLSSRALQITSGGVEFDWTDRFSFFSLLGSNFTLTLGADPGRSPGFGLSAGRVNPSFQFQASTGFGSGQLRVGERVWDLP